VGRLAAGVREKFSDEGPGALRWDLTRCEGHSDELAPLTPEGRKYDRADPPRGLLGESFGGVLGVGAFEDEYFDGDVWFEADL
jgi:hypothetical protein